MKLIEEEKEGVLSIRSQCKLLKLNRSSYYREKKRKKELIFVKKKEEELKSKILKYHSIFPMYGHRKLRECIMREGEEISRKKVLNLMKELKIKALMPKRKLSKSNKENKKYPYLLRGLEIERANQVWVSDITYIRIGNKGYVYLVGIMDVYSRKILSWKLSNSLNVEFLEESFIEAKERYGLPEIFNSDQGSQYTSERFTSLLEYYEILISMDGKGRALDNVYIERFWKTLKYEDIYLNYYETVVECREGIDKYIKLYNKLRVHQSLGYLTPDEKYFGLDKQKLEVA